MYFCSYFLFLLSHFQNKDKGIFWDSKETFLLLRYAPPVYVSLSFLISFTNTTFYSDLQFLGQLWKVEKLLCVFFVLLLGFCWLFSFFSCTPLHNQQNRHRKTLSEYAVRGVFNGFANNYLFLCYLLLRYAPPVYVSLSFLISFIPTTCYSDLQFLGHFINPILRLFQL